MNRRWAAAACLLLWGCAHGSPGSGATYRIVGPDHRLEAGEVVELRLVPEPLSEARVFWDIEGNRGAPMEGAIYRAPFVIPSGAPPVVVSATISEPLFRQTVSWEIDLAPGSVPSIVGCLGPEQEFSALTADVALPRMDRAPETIRPIQPAAPFSIREAQTVVVHAFICRTGNVLDAWASTREAGRITVDPRLAEAAVRAVRQSLFQPARDENEPVAAWTTVPVRFSP